MFVKVTPGKRMDRYLELLNFDRAIRGGYRFFVWKMTALCSCWIVCQFWFFVQLRSGRYFDIGNTSFLMVASVQLPMVIFIKIFEDFLIFVFVEHNRFESQHSLEINLWKVFFFKNNFCPPPPPHSSRDCVILPEARDICAVKALNKFKKEVDSA